MRIALVAGETSGDMLGAGLIEQLKQRFPEATFEGIGGPLMIKQGMQSYVPMERLSVMGLVEVLGRLFELLAVRKNLIKRWQANPPDIFIGIDAPDFNTTLELKLRQSGIKTVHYVSPSVWAWRQNRVFKIKRAVDLMLTLFPFEAKFYEVHQVPVRCVGHHLADKIALDTPQQPARTQLGLALDTPTVCIMPGSRAGEVERLGHLFLKTAELMWAEDPQLQFTIPAANDERRQQIEALLTHYSSSLPVRVFTGQSRECMAASDAVLLASGTAALEAMLLKKPMVVSYKVAPTTHSILKRLVKQEYVSLPNLLAGKELVPEFIQDDATPEHLAEAMLSYLKNPQASEDLQQTYQDIHQQIKRDADVQAADAIAELIDA